MNNAIPDIDAQSLANAARAAARHAHAPYSGFGVGAAALLDDGSIIGGCNFENASYGLTLCAEAVALGSVTAAGAIRRVRAIAIVGGRIAGDALIGDQPVYPCGRCRQLIHEVAQMAGLDLPVLCVSGDGETVVTTMIGILLPNAFGPRDLGLA